MRQPRKRISQAKPIVPQKRDEQVLKLLYLCDGLMLEEQLLRCCFNNHPKNASQRLRALFDNRYLNRNWRDKDWKKFPRLVYWLGEHGFDVVERMLGTEVDRNNKLVRSENPASTWPHHFAVVDFRLKVMRDIAQQSRLNLGPWYTEGFFRARAWKSHAKVSLKTEAGRLVKRSVIPDSFFPIWWQEENPRKNYIFGFLLEVDRRTEPQQSADMRRQATIVNKLRASPALFDAPLYQETFDLRTGRCLMVTTGWKRAEHMMELAREYQVGWAWYFTTFEQANDPEVNVVTDLIWRVADELEPTSIIPAVA